MPPNGNAGESMYWNCWNGYGTPKYCSSDASAEPTWAWSESDFDFAGARGAHEKARMPRSAGEALPRSGGEREEIRRQRIRLAKAVRGRARDPAVESTCVVMPFAIAVHARGTFSVSVRRAFRSGWSKQGKSRFASDGTSSV